MQHQQKATPDAAVAPPPLLALMPHGHEGKRQAETPDSHMTLERNADSDHPWQAEDAQAAYINAT